MIRINLLTVKRRKPIQIPFAAIFLLFGIVGIIAGYHFATLGLDGYNDDLMRQCKALDAQVTKAQDFVRQQENLNRQVSSIKDEIRKLKQLSGASLLQWSQAFSSLTSVVPKKNVWITNLRVDTDRRVQMTAYSCNDDGKEEPKEGGRLTKGIQEFIQTLQRDEDFSDVFLTSATKNTYEKMPVWRFEISCRIRRELVERSSH
jgi:hypothetical protein